MRAAAREGAVIHGGLGGVVCETFGSSPCMSRGKRRLSVSRFTRFLSVAAPPSPGSCGASCGGCQQLGGGALFRQKKSFTLKFEEG